MEHLLTEPCLEWAGRVDKDGYGKLYREGRDWPVHRWVWMLLHGRLPPEICVLHHCDNRRCFRISHLFEGTTADNNRDAAAKGRSRSRTSGMTHCAAGHALDPPNGRVRVLPGGKSRRICRTCEKEAGARYRERLRLRRRA